MSILQSGYLNIVLRSLVVYLALVLGLRLFGKKELSQLSVIDLVFILLISNAVQNAMTGPDTSLPGGLVAAATLLAVNFGLKQLIFRSTRAEKLLEGEALMLILKGRVKHEHLRQVQMTIDELEEAVREHGVYAIDQVDLAMLEKDGNISVLSNDFQHKTTRRRKGHKAVTKSDAV